jgi:hypothetical protein
MTVEQHKIYIRLTTLAAKRAAAKFLRNLADDDPSVVEDFDFDGRTRAGYYWAIRVINGNGRVRFPEGHPNAGGLIGGWFLIMAWQGPLDALPDKILPFIIPPESFNTIYPGFPPEVLG